MTFMEGVVAKTPENNLLGIAGISWGAMLCILGFVLGYRHCQNTNDNILECVKAGQNAIDCQRAFQRGH